MPPRASALLPGFLALRERPRCHILGAVGVGIEAMQQHGVDALDHDRLSALGLGRLRDMAGHWLHGASGRRSATDAGCGLHATGMRSVVFRWAGHDGLLQILRASSVRNTRLSRSSSQALSAFWSG